MIEIMSPSPKSSYMLLNRVPSTNSIETYSVSAALAGVGKYLYTVGFLEYKAQLFAVQTTKIYLLHT